MKWISTHTELPEMLSQVLFYDPFSSYMGFGKFLPDGFHANGEIFNPTHWLKVAAPSREEIIKELNLWLDDAPEEHKQNIRDWIEEFSNKA